MIKTAIKACGFAMLTMSFLPSAWAQEQPLPDFDTMWKAMKPYLMGQYDQTEILKGYTYRVHSHVSELGKGNAIKRTNEFESEVYYFDHGPFYKLIRRNGIPLTQKELEKQEAAFEKFKKEGPRRSGPPWRGHKRSPKEQEDLLDDVHNVFDFDVLRRELRGGRSTIVVHFKPRRNPKLNTLVARVFLSKMEGTAWVDELDHRIAKIDADFIKDGKFGFGLVATVDDESGFHREWVKVNDEIWLPSRSESRVKGRVLLAKGINVRAVEEFSDYKKFSVETTFRLTDSPR